MTGAADDLGSLADKANEEFDAETQDKANAKDHRIAAGEHLIAAKAALKASGSNTLWSAWVEANSLNRKLRACQLCMKLAGYELDGQEQALEAERQRAREAKQKERAKTHDDVRFSDPFVQSEDPVEQALALVRAMMPEQRKVWFDHYRMYIGSLISPEPKTVAEPVAAPALPELPPVAIVTPAPAPAIEQPPEPTYDPDGLDTSPADPLWQAFQGCADRDATSRWVMRGYVLGEAPPDGASSGFVMAYKDASDDARKPLRARLI
jgi:hypothetical protein